MRASLVALCGLLGAVAGCATARTQAYEVRTTAPVQMRGMVGSSINVTLTNTGRRTAPRIAISCQFFDAAGAAVNTGATFFNNLGPGASDTNGIMVITPGVASSQCVVR